MHWCGRSEARRRCVLTRLTCAHTHTHSQAGLYHCNYCMRDISSTIRIKCAVCQDWDLCMDCFAAGE